MDPWIEAFLKSPPFAVVGASPKRTKFGNKLLRCYLQHGLPVYPVHPAQEEIEGLRCYPSIDKLPELVRAITIVIPPQATEKLVPLAAAAGVQHLWMQPGAESQQAIDEAKRLGLSVIAGGPCLLRVLGFDDEA